MLVECEHCGKRVAERAVRCPFCGQRVRAPAEPATPPSDGGEPLDGPQAPTKAVDLAKLARLAHEIESAQARQRTKRERNKVLGILAAGLVVAGLAVAMMPWLRSVQALSALGDLKGGGGAHMAAQRVAAETANEGGGETGPNAESSDAGAGDAAKALAERAGSGLAPPTDLPPSAQAPASAGPAPESAPSTSGTASVARLDDLARSKRPAAHPKTPTAASAQSEAQAQRSNRDAPDVRTWLARLAGFVVGCALAALVSWGSGLGASGAGSGRVAWWARVAPSVAVALGAAAYLARDVGPELARRWSNSSPMVASSPSSPGRGARPAATKPTPEKHPPGAGPSQAAPARASE